MDFDGQTAHLKGLFDQKPEQHSVDAVMMVGMRQPNDALYHALLNQYEGVDAGSRPSIRRIGDVLAPGAIVHAVYSGHEFARSLVSGEQDLYLRDEPIASAEPIAVFDALSGELEPR